MGLTADRYGVSFWGDGNVGLDSGGCIHSEELDSGGCIHSEYISNYI